MDDGPGVSAARRPDRVRPDGRRRRSIACRQNREGCPASRVSAGDADTVALAIAVRPSSPPVPQHGRTSRPAADRRDARSHHLRRTRPLRCARGGHDRPARRADPADVRPSVRLDGLLLRQRGGRPRADPARGRPAGLRSRPIRRRRCPAAPRYSRRSTTRRPGRCSPGSKRSGAPYGRRGARRTSTSSFSATPRTWSSRARNGGGGSSRRGAGSAARARCSIAAVDRTSTASPATSPTGSDGSAAATTSWWCSTPTV